MCQLSNQRRSEDIFVLAREIAMTVHYKYLTNTCLYHSSTVGLCDKLIIINMHLSADC